MGFGDQLLAAGQAQVRYDQSPADGPVTICDLAGMPRWMPLWQGNPVIREPTRKMAPFQEPYILNGKGCLPYLHYPYSADTGWRFTSWRARDHRGKLYLTELEKLQAAQLRAAHGPFILVEPPPNRRQPNRAWPIDNWHELVAQLQRVSPYAILQLSHGLARLLDGTIAIPQPGEGFRGACVALSAAQLLICMEGGLAHAAAALKIPAVVLFGGNISVEALGYPEHTNLIYDHPLTPCGSLKPCDHCAAAWAALKPVDVTEAVLQTGRS